MDIKRRSYAQQNRSLQMAAVPVHPLLLFGRAKTNPNDVRGGPIDGGHEFFFLRFGPGFERRRACARNHEPWKPALEDGRESVRDAGRPANQEMTTRSEEHTSELQSRLH